VAKVKVTQDHYGDVVITQCCSSLYYPDVVVYFAIITYFKRIERWVLDDYSAR